MKIEKNIMKSKFNKILLILCSLVFATCFIFVSCEEDDSKKTWGYAMIYMPQAAIQNGGIDNIYPVPFSTSPATQNYELDEENGLLHIYLGVYRSGLQPLEAFAVRIGVDDAATAAAVAEIGRSIALPATSYTLPERVTVANGEREAMFELTVDLNYLEDNYEHIGLNSLVLVVGLSEPSKYELNPELAQTTIVIRGRSFLSTPPAQYGPEMILGGAFDSQEDFDDYWTVKDQLGDAFDPSMARFDNGRLRMEILNPPDPIRAGFSVFQQITLVRDQEYEFDFEIEATGASSEWVQFFATFTRVDPNEGSTHGGNAFRNDISVWTSTMSAAVPAYTAIGNPIEKTSFFEITNAEYTRIDRESKTFTAPFSGTWYIVFFMSVSGIDSGDAGTIWIDNVTLREISYP